MPVDQIRSLLIDHIDSFSFSPMPEIAKPDEGYDPRVGIRYIELVYQPNETFSPFVGNDDPQQQRGFLQVTVVGPRVSTDDVGWQVAAAIIDHYKKGTILRGTGGVNVKVVRKPWAAPPFPDEGWQRIPVTIPYLCIA